ncbi:30S ribosomal protein S1 [Clostridium sp. YIM B02515]|uniref:30S ribosomal protein S1 n=1 Tax=Clostridium rhizosphaerae TaxID=2803861 RepID=A0ABS1T687_9CLOT|nr:30S ribosomal protein S1 [Clostridium rhizosphaerae]
MNEIKSEEFNEQLAFMNENLSSVSVGKIIKGTVISLNEKEAYINIGYKSDGYLPKEEVVKDSNTQLSDLLKVGDEIEVKVINRNNEDGYVVLSRTEIERDEALKQIKSIYENKETITAVIKEAVNGGLISSYRGVRVFIPASHIELFHVNNMEHYIGKEVEINIIEFSQDRKGTRIVGSRRELLKKEKEKKEELAWETLKEGDKVTGEVKRLTNFGAFVDVNGVDGLLHVSEISWGKVNKPGDVLKVGHKVEAVILSLDKENKKLSLSIKALTENPWTGIEEKYPVGNIVLGKVVRFAAFGAFVELEPGVDGLVHISQISNKRIANPSEVLEINQMVKAKILEVNRETKRISLSIREIEEV